MSVLFTFRVLKENNFEELVENWGFCPRSRSAPAEYPFVNLNWALSAE